MKVKHKMASKLKKLKDGSLAGSITKSTTGKIDLFQISLTDKDKFKGKNYHATFKEIDDEPF